MRIFCLLVEAVAVARALEAVEEPEVTSTLKTPTCPLVH
jgi:hypothetical protein